MTPTNKVNMLNINSLVIEVEEVIKNGLNKILVNYMDRYELLENTHKQLMQLPSIRQQLNKDPYDLCSDDDNDEVIYYKNNKNMHDNSTVETLEYRLEKLEKKYDTIIPVLDKILNKIITLDQDIKSLKSSESISLVKSSNCKPSEKENIKIYFEESNEELVEEDVNPALITCSTITLNSESEKVSEEKDTTKPDTSVIPSDRDTIGSQDEEEEQELSVDEELSEHEEPVVEEKSVTYIEDESEEDESEEDEDVDVEDNVNDESEPKIDHKLDGDVEDESEEDEDVDVEDNVNDESEPKIDHNLDGDVDTKSHDTVEAVVDSDTEEEASIETETKSETEEEEDDLEEELVKEAELVREIVQEKQPPQEEDDEELFEIEIDDKTYCTNDDQNGFIWELTEDGEQGEKIGYLKDGDAYFYEDEN